MKLRLTILVSLLALATADAQFLQHRRKAFRTIAVTFLLNETWEGTGWPASWWTGSAADPDNTTSPLAGAQDLFVQAAEATEFTLSPAQPTVYGKFLFKISSLTGYRHIVNISDSSFSDVFRITSESGGALTVQAGGVFETTGATMAINTPYYVWFRYTKGGESRVWFNSADSKPADGSANSAGATNTATADAEKFYFQSLEGTPQDCQFDNIQLAITPF
jgi:hypothetical protein